VLVTLAIELVANTSRQRSWAQTRRVPSLSVEVKLADESAPGQIVVTAMAITRQVWPGALDADGLAILPPAPEALLTPVA
jgi:hypothetical protein